MVLVWQQLHAGWAAVWKAGCADLDCSCLHAIAQVLDVGTDACGQHRGGQPAVVRDRTKL